MTAIAYTAIATGLTWADSSRDLIFVAPYDSFYINGDRRTYHGNIIQKDISIYWIKSIWSIH